MNIGARNAVRRIDDWNSWGRVGGDGGRAFARLPAFDAGLDAPTVRMLPARTADPAHGGWRSPPAAATLG